MMETLLNSLFDGLIGNKVRRSKRPREVGYGDVVCVDGGLLRRYGIWAGDNFILYGEDCHGKNLVHEESFRGFMHGAEHFAICEFPEKYGNPTLWAQPVPVSAVVMPQEKIWRLLERTHKAGRYKRYSPNETVSRARSKLGESGYLTSEHFALWCKTGISESHELENIRDFCDRIVVY